MSTFLYRTLLPAGLLSVACGCTTGPAETKVLNGTAVDHGAALFRNPAVAKTSLNTYSCATCHETTAGELGNVVVPGALLAGSPKRPSYWGGYELDLLAAINHCLYYFMLKNQAWTAEDVEARAMYAYLESLPEDAGSIQAAPFTVTYILNDVPAGDSANGGVTYSRACASCHGAVHNGKGRLVAWAPVLPEQTLDEHPLGEYTAAERLLVFVEKIRHGGFIGYGGEMPPFSTEKLSDQDIGDLLSFFGIP